jgi:hypothetical protein
MIETLRMTAPVPGAGQFLGVDWGSIALVSIVALIATVVIVTSYSTGLRLLAVGAPTTRRAIATVGAIVCIGIGIAGVLYGIYLVIPLFH